MQHALQKSTSNTGPSTGGGHGTGSAPSLSGENLQLDGDVESDSGTPMLSALGLGSGSSGGGDDLPTEVADYLELLRASDNPTRTYRRLARRAHPDKGGSREAWDALQVAHERVLSGEEEREAGNEDALEGPLAIEDGPDELPEPDSGDELLAIEAPEPLLMLEAPPERSAMDEYVDARDEYQSNMDQVLRDYGEKKRAEREAEEKKRRAEEAERKKEKQREEEARRKEEEARRLNAEAAKELSQAFEDLGPSYKKLTVKPEGLDPELGAIKKAIRRAEKSESAVSAKADLLQRIQRASQQISDQLALVAEEASVKEDLQKARESLGQSSKRFSGSLRRAKGLTDDELSWDPDAKARLQDPKGRLDVIQQEITRRSQALERHLQELEGNPQVDRTRSQAARQALSTDGDLSTLDAVDDDLQVVKDAVDAFDRKKLDAKKKALTRQYADDDHKLSPKRRRKIDTWVDSGVPKTRVSKTAFEDLIKEELTAQYKVNKSQWLDLLGLSPWGKLWGDDSVGKVGSYNVHASLYKDVMAGIVEVDKTSVGDAQDSLLSSGTSGFHVTMEAFGKFGDGGHNPHSYRNGPTRKGDYPGTDWGTSAKAAFQKIRDDQVDAKEGLIKTTVEEKARNLEG